MPNKNEGINVRRPEGGSGYIAAWVGMLGNADGAVELGGIMTSDFYNG